jgi:hypothetical protein
MKAIALHISNHAAMKRNIDFICDEVKKLELNVTLASAQVLRKIIHDEIILDAGKTINPAFGNEIMAILPRHIYGRYRNFSKELVTRFKDELSAKILFAVNAAKVQYIGSDFPLFGEEVFNKFPSANDDIAEAGTCLALDRGTACVMHLMRAAEVALGALAAILGVSKQNDWGSYLREIEKELAKRAKIAGARTADEQFYAEASTCFDHLKRAWRNPTMHVDRSYSPDRAEEIFQAVRSFMRNLATKVSE